MNQNPIIIIIVFLLSILGISFFNIPSFYPNIYQGYDRNVSQYYSTSNQEKVLGLAESFDYGKLLDTNGVTGGGKDIWIEYINNETLKYIDSYAEANKQNTHITLNYTSWVYEFNQIILSKTSNDFSILANGINYATKNSTGYSEKYSLLYNYNSSSNWYDKIETDFNISYTFHGYIVDMKLTFDNVFGDLGATFSSIRQTLIFSENYEILHLLFHPTEHYIS